jgi:dipeptidyl aminopeptidase/acylaminoacyl peptidase/outer membrane protein assembly factor BamB
MKAGLIAVGFASVGALLLGWEVPRTPAQQGRPAAEPAPVKAKPAGRRRFEPADLVRLVGVSDPQIAPDGRAIVVVVSRANVGKNRFDTELVLVDVATGARRVLTHDREGVGQPRWSPTGDRLAFLANAGAGDKARRQVFVMPMNGGDARRVTGAPEGVQHFAWGPDGKQIAFAAADERKKKQGVAKYEDAFEVGNNDYLATAAPTPTHLWLVAAEGGKARRLTSGDWSLPTVPPPGPPASPLSWSPDGRSIAVVRQARPHFGDADKTAVQIVPTAGGAPRPLTNRTALEGYPSFSPDGTHLLYWYPREDDINNVNEVWLAPASGGAGKSLTRKLDRNLQRCLWMPDGKAVLVGGHDGTRVALWLQPLDGPARRLNLGAVSPSWLYWVDVTVGKGGAIAFTGSAPRGPTELYYLASPTAAPRRLTDFNRDVAALDLGRVEAITWKGPDGFDEDGVLTYPPGFSAKNQYPLVLYIHGGPTSASTEQFSALPQLIAAHGYVVFSPNYRGSDNRGNAYQRAIFNDAGAGPGRDVMAGLEAVRKRGFVDPGRIAVTGWSYGGFMTTWLIGHHDVWKTAIAGAALTDWNDAYNFSDFNVQARFSFGGSPWVGDRAKAYREQSPITYAAKIKTPTLILATTGDARVPITQSYRLYHALRDNNVPTRFIAYPVSGHSPGDPVRFKDLCRRWVRWLDQHLDLDLTVGLWEAAKKGDGKVVQALLERGADPDIRTPYGATALHYAADKGHAEVARALLEHKADVNARDTFYGARPLDWAVMRSRAAVIRLLVRAGAADLDSTLKGAAAQGNREVVEALLGAGRFRQEVLDQTLEMTPGEQKAVRELLTKAGARARFAAVFKGKALSLDDFAGTYRDDSGLTLKITVADLKLTMTPEGSKQKTVLAGGAKGVFKIPGSDEATITFRMKDGKPSALVFTVAKTERVLNRVPDTPAAVPPAATQEEAIAVQAPGNWPSFRGPGASGVADGQHPPTSWDAAKGVNVRWKTPIPGLGHSCPVVWGGRVFLTTAVSGDPKASLRAGLYGDVDSVEDRTRHTWKVYCLDRDSGKVLWERTAHEGVPKTKRHLKATQANSTAATDGRHVVALFGSEGMYCYDLEGRLLWKSDLGVLESGWFYDKEYEWGFGSSPVIFRDKVIVQCDVGKDSFIAAFRLTDGQPVWKTPRDEIPSWGTPTVVEAPGGVEVVTAATKFARGYDPETGRELWRLGRHAEITVPTPFFAQGLIFVTSGYRPVQPIYAIRPGAHGDITLAKGKTASKAIAWSTSKGGPYLPTPLVYGDHLYVCSNYGVLACFEAKTGKQVYKERLGGTGGYTASPVAADGRLYFTSEEGGTRVVRAGPKFELLAVNPLGEVCLATPAIADGMIFVRTEHHLFAFGATRRK